MAGVKEILEQLGSPVAKSAVSQVNSSAETHDSHITQNLPKAQSEDYQKLLLNCFTPFRSPDTPR